MLCTAINKLFPSGRPLNINNVYISAPPSPTCQADGHLLNAQSQTSSIQRVVLVDLSIANSELKLNSEFMIYYMCCSVLFHTGTLMAIHTCLYILHIHSCHSDSALTPFCVSHSQPHRTHAARHTRSLKPQPSTHEPRSRGVTSRWREPC